MRYLILALALTLPLSVGAFNPEDLERLKKTNKCPNCDLSGADLLGAILWDSNLEKANLGFANLQGAKLNAANLQGAFLVYANLKGADLTGADLRGADLRGAFLFKANLDGAYLGSVRLCNTTMPDGRVLYSGCPPSESN